MTVSGLGWQWFTIFGTTPWRVSMEAPALDAPAHFLNAPSASIAPETASAFVGMSAAGRSSRPAGIFAAASAAGLLPQVPGKANTPDKVLEILKRYPWIFGPFVPDYFQGQQKRAGFKKVDDIFLSYYKTLRQYDRDVFEEQVVGTIRRMNRKPTFAEPLEFIQLYDSGEIDRALGKLVSANPYRLLLLEIASDELIRRSFGCTLEKDAFQHSYVVPADPAKKLTGSQLFQIRHRLYTSGVRPFMSPDQTQVAAFQCATYFLGRAAHPGAFGFSAPPLSGRGLRIGFDSSVYPVMRLTGLPQYPWAYPDGYGEWTTWYRLHRELTPKLLEDKKLIADLLRTAVTDHPLEIVWIDPTEEAVEDFLSRLLAAKPKEEVFGDRFAFRGDKVRLVVKRSVPQINGWRIEEIREYSVLAGANGRSLVRK